MGTFATSVIMIWIQSSPHLLVHSLLFRSAEWLPVQFITVWMMCCFNRNLFNFFLFPLSPFLSSAFRTSYQSVNSMLQHFVCLEWLHKCRDWSDQSAILVGSIILRLYQKQCTMFGSTCTQLQDFFCHIYKLVAVTMHLVHWNVLLTVAAHCHPHPQFAVCKVSICEQTYLPATLPNGIEECSYRTEKKSSPKGAIRPS